MSYPESGLRSDIARGGPGGRLLKSSALEWEPWVYQGMARFHEWTTHWLPVAVKKVSISCYRDGFLRPAVFKKLRDERRHDGGLQEYRDPR
jgi:hypothetical protein